MVSDHIGCLLYKGRVGNAVRGAPGLRTGCPVRVLSCLTFVFGPQLWTEPVEGPAAPISAPPPLLPAAQSQDPCVPDRPCGVSG